MSLPPPAGEGNRDAFLSPQREAILNAFLKRYIDDREEGRVLQSDDYQALWPGDASFVEGIYRRLQVGDPIAFPAGVEPVPAPLGPAPHPFRDRVGPYRLVRELGRGGQATVHLAEDTRLPRRVALKILLCPAAEADAALQRFKREAEVASRLDHPGICPVYESGIENGTAWLAMRFVEGTTLARRIAGTLKEAATRAESSVLLLESQGSVPPDDGGTPGGDSRSPPPRARIAEILRYFERAARALHEAHEAGVIHRDLKPGNLMVTPEGDPVILDFGLAHDAGGDHPLLTQTGEVIGTPAYMSPEQVSGQARRIDRRTDVWSLGATLYEALTLRRPFTAATRDGLYDAILRREAPSPRRVNRAISRDLEVIVLTCLEKEPARRYLTAAALADDLGAARERKPIMARCIGPVGRLLRWSRREPAQAALLIVLLFGLPILTAIGGAYLAQRPFAETGVQVELRRAVEERLASAFAALELDQADEALGLFRQALDLDAGEPAAVAGLALALLDSRRPEEALRILESHRASLEGLSAEGLLRNDCHRALGVTEKTVPGHRETPPSEDPIDGFLLAQRFLREGHAGYEGRSAAYASALEALDRAILLSRQARLFIWTERLHVAGHARNAAAVRGTAEAVRRLWPNSAIGWAVAARALEEIGAMEEAVAAYRHALDLERPPVSVRRNLGRLLAEQGQSSEGLSLCRDAVREQPRSALARTCLGRALEAAGQVQEAIAEFRAAIGLNPDFAENWNRLGAALLKNGDLDEALTMFRRAADTAPGIPNYYVNVGIVLNSLGRVDEAAETFEAVLRRHPEFAPAHYESGRVLFANRRFEDAAARFGMATTFVPGDPKAWANLGRALITLGLDVDAEVAALKATELDPTFVNAWYILSLVLSGRGCWDRALQAAENARQCAGTDEDLTQVAKRIQEVQRLAAEDRRLDAVLESGTESPPPGDLPALAGSARKLRRFALAARWYRICIEQAEALPAGKLVQIYEGAACASAQAGCGRGRDAGGLSANDRHSCRERAREWLLAALDEFRRSVDSDGRYRRTTAAVLRRWQESPELSGVRDPRALESLPPEEREAWASLWAGVAGLLRIVD